MAIKRSALTAVAAVVTVTGAAVLTAAGLAAAQEADPKITACVGQATGNVRIVEAGTACRANESATTWSVRGPAGQPGTAGAPGAAGATGPSGSQGAPGATGPRGDKGDAGSGGGAGTGAAGPVGVLTITGGAGGPATFDVLSFASGITSSLGVGGASAGKATVSNLTITKRIDASSVALRAATSTGLAFSTATLTMCSATNCATAPEMTVTMAGAVQIVSVTESGLTPAVESVSIRSTSITWTKDGQTATFNPSA